MSLESNLASMEKSREVYWLKYQSTAPIKLRWRAVTVRHCFHVLPGERILELGAGNGLWTAHLAEVLRGRNPILGAVFNRDFLEPANQKKIANVEFLLVMDLLREFLPGYLPTDLMKRTVRMVVRIRGIVEDFTALKDFQNSPQQRAFAKILLENLKTCGQELPQLCTDLDKESATDKESPSS